METSKGLVQLGKLQGRVDAIEKNQAEIRKYDAEQFTVLRKHAHDFRDELNSVSGLQQVFSHQLTEVDRKIGELMDGLKDHDERNEKRNEKLEKAVTEGINSVRVTAEENKSAIARWRNMLIGGFAVVTVFGAGAVWFVNTAIAVLK